MDSLNMAGYDLTPTGNRIRTALLPIIQDLQGTSLTH